MGKEQWMTLFAFLVGCILTNLLGKDVLTTHGILNEYFLNQFSYHEIDGSRLFCRILLERGKTAIAIFLFGRVMAGKRFSVCTKCIAAVTFGFLMTVAVVNLGIKGIVICLTALFPQWIFYLAVLLFYADCKREEAERGYYLGDRKKHFVQAIICVVGVILGIVAECYVNPIFLVFVLKIF